MASSRLNLPKISEEVYQEASTYDYIRFTFGDINGVPRGKTVTGRNVRKFLDEGISLFIAAHSFGSTGQLPPSEIMTPFSNTLGNMSVHPDPTTLHPVNWAHSTTDKVGEVLCETFTTDGKIPYEVCPRYVARKQIDKLKSMGYNLFAAHEYEFCVLGDDGKFLFDHLDFCNNYLVAENEKWLFDIEKSLFQSGVDVETLQNDYAPSQFELTLKPMFDIKSADQAFLFKYGVKELCKQKGLSATFMTKPYPGYLGNSGHYNHSLWNLDGTSAMFDDKEPTKFSKVAQHWIAGLLKHAPAITALSCHGFNCYRRLHQVFLPTVANWGVENRHCTLRVKVNGPSGTYIENRTPSGISNPYLVLAAHTAAGIDGIVNKLELPPEHQVENVMELPRTLEKALEALKNDTEMVQALGEEFVNTFITQKYSEVEQFKTHDVSRDHTEEMAVERALYAKFL